MDTESDQNSNDENDNVEVIILFCVISYKVLKQKKVQHNYLPIVPIQVKDENNEAQNMSFESMQNIKNSQSNLISEISAMNLEDNFENILELLEEPKIFEEFENTEPEACPEFSNDAYKDLMLLVTRYKLNNRAGNDIIHFFNKHSNLTKSL